MKYFLSFFSKWNQLHEMKKKKTRNVTRMMTPKAVNFLVCLLVEFINYHPCTKVIKPSYLIHLEKAKSFVSLRKGITLGVFLSSFARKFEGTDIYSVFCWQIILVFWAWCQNEGYCEIGVAVGNCGWEFFSMQGVRCARRVALTLMRAKTTTSSLLLFLWAESQGSIVALFLLMIGKYGPLAWPQEMDFLLYKGNTTPEIRADNTRVQITS